MIPGILSSEADQEKTGTRSYVPTTTVGTIREVFDYVELKFEISV